MDSFRDLDVRIQIFANLFKLGNKVQTKMDRSIKGITAKQWYLLAILERMETSPTLKELSIALDYSHQNTKQLVNKLEDSGYVKIRPDENDRRSIRIDLLDKTKHWANENNKDSQKFILSLFEDFTTSELKDLCESLYKIDKTLNKMD